MKHPDLEHPLETSLALRLARRLTIALMLTLLVGIFAVGIAGPTLAGPRLAAALAEDPVPTFTFGIPIPLVLGIVTGTVIPALVGLISRLVDKVTAGQLSSLAKGLVLSALSALSGILATLGDKLATPEQPIDLGVLLITFVSSFIVAVAFYFGILSRPAASGRSPAAAIQGK